MLLQDKVIIVTSAAQQVLSTLPASTLLPPSLAPARMKPPSGASLAWAMPLPLNWVFGSMLSRRA